MDLRAIDDEGRESVLYELSNQMYQRCEKRSVSCSLERKVRELLLVLHTNSDYQINSVQRTVSA